MLGCDGGVAVAIVAVGGVDVAGFGLCLIRSCGGVGKCFAFSSSPSLFLFAGGRWIVGEFTTVT